MCYYCIRSLHQENHSWIPGHLHISNTLELPLHYSYEPTFFLVRKWKWIVHKKIVVFTEHNQNFVCRNFIYVKKVKRQRKRRRKRKGFCDKPAKLAIYRTACFQRSFSTSYWTVSKLWRHHPYTRGNSLRPQVWRNRWFDVTGHPSPPCVPFWNDLSLQVLRGRRSSSSLRLSLRLRTFRLDRSLWK